MPDLSNEVVRKSCSTCFMIELAGAGYYCYIGRLIMDMEHEPSERKRKRIRQQIDWGLRNLQELDEFKRKIRKEKAYD